MRPNFIWSNIGFEYCETVSKASVPIYLVQIHISIVLFLPLSFSTPPRFHLVILPFFVYLSLCLCLSFYSFVADLVVLPFFFLDLACVLDFGCMHQSLFEFPCLFGLILGYILCLPLHTLIYSTKPPCLWIKYISLNRTRSFCELVLWSDVTLKVILHFTIS